MTKTTKSFEISLLDWRNLVGQVQRFAHQDGTLPALNSVRFYESNGRLQAMATDRYRIAVAAAPKVVTPPAGFSAVVRIDTLTRLSTLLRTPVKRLHFVKLTVTHAGDTLQIDARGLPVIGDLTVGIPLFSPQDVPEIWGSMHGLIAKAIEGSCKANRKVAHTDTFQARFLADYAGLPGLTFEPVTMVHAEPSDSVSKVNPTLIRVGDDFISLLIPTRGGIGTDDWSTWEHLLGGESDGNPS